MPAMARRDIESAESEPPDSQVSPVVAFVTSVTIQAVSRHMAHFDPSHPLWLVSAHVGAQGAPPFCCEPGRFGPRRSRLSGTVSLWKLSGSVCRFSHGRAILRRPEKVPSGYMNFAPTLEANTQKTAVRAGLPPSGCRRGLW